MPLPPPVIKIVLLVSFIIKYSALIKTPGFRTLRTLLFGSQWLLISHLTDLFQPGFLRCCRASPAYPPFHIAPSIPSAPELDEKPRFPQE